MTEQEEFRCVKRWSEVKTGIHFASWIFDLDINKKIHVVVDGYGEIMCDPCEPFQFALQCDKFVFGDIGDIETAKEQFKKILKELRGES